MSSSASPGRKIASNYLFVGGMLVADPLVEADDSGRILAIGSCAAPDRVAGVEFYAGILLPGLVDACCGPLTSSAALRHRNAGTVVAGYTECSGELPRISGFEFNPITSQTHFLSQIQREDLFPAGDAILIDEPLTRDRMAALSGVTSWCLCPFHAEQKMLTETITQLRQQSIVPALGSYTPTTTEIRTLAEWLPALAGESIEEVLAWATGYGTQWPGTQANELHPGKYSGLNLLSGCDYRTLRLTESLRVTRIL